MNPCSIDIKDLIVAAGLGTFKATTGWGVYVSKEPKEPDTVITVYDTGGFSPNPRFPMDEPTVQVRVRGAPGAYMNAWAKAYKIRDALLGYSNAPLSTVIFMDGDIFFLEYDDNNRPVLTLNFRVMREPETESYAHR